MSHRSLSLYSGVPGAQAGGESGDQAGAGGGNMATTAAATSTSCGHTAPGAEGGEHAQVGVRGAGAGAGLHPDLAVARDLSGAGAAVAGSG